MDITHQSPSRLFNSLRIKNNVEKVFGEGREVIFSILFFSQNLFIFFLFFSQKIIKGNLILLDITCITL